MWQSQQLPIAWQFILDVIGRTFTENKIISFRTCLLHTRKIARLCEQRRKTGMDHIHQTYSNITVVGLGVPIMKIHSALPPWSVALMMGA